MDGSIDNFQPMLTPPQTGTNKEESAEMLENLVSGKNVTSTSVEGQAQVLSRDEIVQIKSKTQFSDKYNLGAAFSSSDLSQLAADVPSLPNVKNIGGGAGEIIKEIMGNEWLSSSFLTTLTANILEVVKIKMQQRQQEGDNTVELMKQIGDLGKAVGDLALKKAELEAQMHMFQAMAAIASFCITVAAGALTIAGTAATTISSGVKTNAATKDPAAANASASSKPIGATNVATPAKTSTPAQTTPTPAPNATPTNTPQNVQMGTHKTTAQPQAQPQAAAAGQPQAQQGVQGGVAQQRWVKGEGPNAGTGSTNQASGGAGAPAESSLNKMGPKSKDSEGVNAQGHPTADPKAIKKAENWEAGAEFARNFGQTFLQASPQLGNAADNFVQMAFKPQIGEVERESQIRQTQKQIAQQSLESASKDFSEAGQAIDSALQALQKVQDETSRAHSLSRG